MVHLKTSTACSCLWLSEKKFCGREGGCLTLLDIHSQLSTLATRVIHVSAHLLLSRIHFDCYGCNCMRAQFPLCRDVRKLRAYKHKSFFSVTVDFAIEAWQKSSAHLCVLNRRRVLVT